MELQTISQVSKDFSISTRTLRYYEQIGLITAVRKEDFAYRVYDICECVKTIFLMIYCLCFRILFKHMKETNVRKNL